VLLRGACPATDHGSHPGLSHGGEGLQVPATNHGPATPPGFGGVDVLKQRTRRTDQVDAGPLVYEGRKALCRSCDRIGFYVTAPSGARFCDAERHELRCVCGELDTASHDCAETWEWI
jgi:hypothetical protein